MKTCSKCGETQPLTEFWKHPAMRDGHRNDCKTCVRSYNASRRAVVNAQRASNRAEVRAKHREYRAQRLERDREAVMRRERNNRLKSMYSISLDDYERMFAEQDGRCGICHQQSDDRRLAVDHDHACCAGKKSCGACVRGLLCARCNTSLGFYETFEEEVTAWRSYDPAGSAV